jgi:hypothetical protein
MGLLWVCKLVEERCRHLRTHCVVYAGKDVGLHLEFDPGLLAYTLTLAAAAFTSYIVRSSVRSS